MPDGRPVEPVAEGMQNRKARPPLRTTLNLGRQMAPERKVIAFPASE